MTHLLDTNVCIAVLRGNALVQTRMRLLRPSDCGVSVVSLYELHSGAARCREPEAERAKIATFARPLPRLPFDEDAATRTALLRWQLEQRGEIIGPYDLMIAGQALSLGVTLVTHNVREFRRVPDLLIEDWQVP